MAAVIRSPGSTECQSSSQAYDSDNADYAWLPSTYHPGEGENQGCAQCHSNAGSEITVTLPVDEWLLDAHSLSAHNERFLSMYSGTDTAGNQSPLTRYGFSRDYGAFPLLPDPDLPYFGPGYKLDFPESAGNCAACHTPLAAVDNPYGIDPTALTGIDTEGISCDFCHKVNDVALNPESGLPESNMPGVLSFSFLRPPEGHQFFAGPLNDVAPGEDTYAPIQKMSQFWHPAIPGFSGILLFIIPTGNGLKAPIATRRPGRPARAAICPQQARPFLLCQSRAAKSGILIRSSATPCRREGRNVIKNALSMSATARQENDVISVEVTLLNDKTGHHVPTDSPLRQMILLVEARSSENQALKLIEGPTIPDWGGIGDPSKGYYAGLPGKGYAKILKEKWTGFSPSGAYWNPTEIVSDNRLAAYESDVSRYTFSLPQGNTAIIDVKLFFRRAFIELMDQKSWDSTPDILMEQLVVAVPVEQNAKPELFDGYKRNIFSKSSRLGWANTDPTQRSEHRGRNF